MTSTVSPFHICYSQLPLKIPLSRCISHSIPYPGNSSNSVRSSSSVAKKASVVKVNSEISEIRVCTNRTCRRQGSMQTLETLIGISPPNVVVKSCGCLGRCGSGPNIVVLPGPVMVSHCGTPARAADVMVEIFGGGSELEEESRKCLEALALRKRAEAELSNGNCSEAESLFSQAINLKSFGGIHVAYMGRSIVQFKMGNFSGSLADAEEALKLSPSYAEAYICKGDALMAMDQLNEAEAAYSTALEKDPSICRLKSFKARISSLQDKLVSSSVH